MGLKSGVCTCNNKLPFSDDKKSCCKKFCTKCTGNEKCTTCRSDFTLHKFSDYDTNCLCVGDYNSKNDVCKVCPNVKYYSFADRKCQTCGPNLMPKVSDPLVLLDRWECMPCVGTVKYEVKEDTVTCEPCGPEKYFNENGEDGEKYCDYCPDNMTPDPEDDTACIDCIGTVEDDHYTCTECPDD